MQEEEHRARGDHRDGRLRLRSDGPDRLRLGRGRDWLCGCSCRRRAHRSQIAAIVVAANQVDIDAGNLALKKTKNEDVKKFAQQMVTDHTAVNKAAVDLVTKLKVTPEETDASKGLVSGGADNRAKLEKLDGAEFDKAYVDNEVAYHKAVIDTIDQKLVPSASNAELKSTLVGVKPAFEEHLKHAEMLQSQLNGGSGAHKM